MRPKSTPCQTQWQLRGAAHSATCFVPSDGLGTLHRQTGKALRLLWSSGRSPPSREAALAAVLCARAVPSQPGESCAAGCSPPCWCGPPHRARAPRRCSESRSNKGGDGRDQRAMRTWTAACTLGQRPPWLSRDIIWLVQQVRRTTGPYSLLFASVSLQIILKFITSKF